MKKTIAIIGGGASALALASMLNESLFDTTIYERQATLGRKFLVAGDGGFNLTHGEDLEDFLPRYTVPISNNSSNQNIENSFRNFTNIDTRDWLKSIGIETFIGSSNRVFPTKGIKPIEVLNAILSVLKNKQIKLKTKCFWQGWNAQNELIMLQNGVEKAIKADIVVFSLGGSSWTKTGSDGTWTSYFEEKGISIIPFQASNCAYKIAWSNTFLAKSEGKSLKNIALKCSDKVKKGEVVVTKFGLEGGAIYALSPAIREQLNEHQKATIFMDLKPVLSVADIINKLTEKNNKPLTTLLKEQLHLPDAAVALLKNQLTKEEFIHIPTLATLIKNIPLSITAAAPIDEAISTVGGIPFDEVDEHFQLKKLPNHYVIGEMLDWDAPTGGYLLQACFSMGAYVAKLLNNCD